MNRLFLTLFVLRTGLALAVVAGLFGVSESSASNYFVATVFALVHVFQQEMPFPSQAIIRGSSPETYVEMFGHNRVRIIIDATNVNIPTSSDPQVQTATYSSYYGGNVVKLLVGISPSGAITFVSLPFPGKISDVDLTDVSIIRLELLDSLDVVMADKGFTIQHILLPLMIGTMMPPKKERNVAQFSQEQTVLTREIANKRIHVERAMARIKNFRFLAGTVPFPFLDILGQIVFVVCFLGNYHLPLRDRVVEPGQGLYDDVINLSSSSSQSPSPSSSSSSSSSSSHSSSSSSSPSSSSSSSSASADDLEVQNAMLRTRLAQSDAHVSSLANRVATSPPAAETKDDPEPTDLELLGLHAAFVSMSLGPADTRAGESPSQPGAWLANITSQIHSARPGPSAVPRRKRGPRRKLSYMQPTSSSSNKARSKHSAPENRVAGKKRGRGKRAPKATVLTRAEQEEKEDAVATSVETYCLCNKPWPEDDEMFGCDVQGCEEWYCRDCLPGTPPLQNWTCPKCTNS